VPLLVVLLIAAASPSPRWTFCVAESGADVWISGVFSAAEPRERLEARFSKQLRAQGVVNPVTQCPEPNADKTEAFNAQFTAAEFHRKLGQTLHALAPSKRR
jgi:hypothetical protein